MIIFVILWIGFFVGAMIYDKVVRQPKREQLKELEENERLLDREILRSIYATQKLTLFDKDGLRIKPFAQGILKQISELKFLLSKYFGLLQYTML